MYSPLMQMLEAIEERLDDLSPEKRALKEESKRERDLAATRVQASYRGMKGRRHVKEQIHPDPTSLNEAERAGVAALMGKKTGGGGLLGRARCGAAPAAAPSTAIRKALPPMDGGDAPK